MEKKPIRKPILFLIILAGLGVLVAIGKGGLYFYYRHDSHTSVSSSVKFDEKTKEIRVSDIKFYIPINLIITREEKYFKLQDTSGDYVIRIDVTEDNFDEMVEKYSNVKLGIDASYEGKISVKEYGGKKYIVSETAKGITKNLMACTKLSDTKIARIKIENKKNTYDYGLLEKYSTIINNAKN